MQVSEKSITQMGYKRQESRPFLVFIARPLILRNFRAQNRAAPLLKLRLPGFTQSWTENRCALFLELLSWFHAIPDGKPLRTFPGIVVVGFAIPDGKPLRTFPGIVVVGFAIPDGKPLRTFPGIALGNLA
ncbi:hypothetical protein [Rhizobium leguminosarum]